MATPQRREQNIVGSNKSEAEVANNKRLCWTYCTIELTDTKHPAASLRQQSYLF